jgi:tetratricopeptide (TPR) repeat protein
VGSGGLAKAFAANDSMRTAGIFAGFLLRTNPEAARGGLEVMGEFDGSGINAGVRIPITTDYKLNLGISQLQWLPNFGKANTTELPAISAGLSLEIPRLAENIKRRGRTQFPPAGKGLIPAGTNWDTQPEAEDKTSQAKIDSVLRLADIEIQKLNDSLRVTVAEVHNLQNTVTNLRQQKVVLEDSLQSVKLQHHVMEQNINLALKHLSRSLRFFYGGNYSEALDEVDMAIQLNPNLALAYARRGSIYYKMGDIERATINWNLALRIDPEYEDVRNILKIINENRIRTASYQRGN